MSDRPPPRRNRRVRLAVAIAFIVVGGAIAAWNQPPVMVSSAPSASKAEFRVGGRVWTRLPGVVLSGLPVQLIQRDRTVALGPWRGTRQAETDARGRFAIVGEVPAATEADAEIYLHSPPADDRWTYSPARITLRPGRTTDGVENELVEGVEVEGRFVDADRDDPVTPVRVAAIGPGRLSFLGSVAPRRDVDGRGCFRFRLAPGEAELVALEVPAAYMKAYAPRGFRQKAEIPRGVRSITLPPFRLRSDGKTGESKPAR